jgi:hypothetical protein
MNPIAFLRFTNRDTDEAVHLRLDAITATYTEGNYTVVAAGGLAYIIRESPTEVLDRMDEAIKHIQEHGG